MFWVSTRECFAMCDDRAWYRQSGVFLWLPKGDVRIVSQLQWLPKGDVELCGAPSCCSDWSRRGVWRSDHVTCDGVLEIKKKIKKISFKLKITGMNFKVKEMGIFELLG